MQEHSQDGSFDEVYSNPSPLKEYLDGCCDLLVLCEPNGSIYFRVKTTQQIKATKFANFAETLVCFDFRGHGKNRKQIIITNCAEPYNILALRPSYPQEVPGWGIFRSSVTYLSQRIVSPDMIIPITENHIFVLQHTPPVKDEFISEIMTSQQFGEIVKFTQQYQFQPNCHSSDEISECYKALLGDIYDACIKNPCQKCRIAN